MFFKVKGRELSVSILLTVGEAEAIQLRRAAAWKPGRGSGLSRHRVFPGVSSDQEGHCFQTPVLKEPVAQGR